VIRPAVEKVVRKELAGGIPLPTYLATLMKFFHHQVRQNLNPKEGVLAMWINSRGNPLEYNSYRQALQDTIADLLEDDSKRIGALAFRRIIPTLCFANEITLKGESMKDFRDKYASLINTSTVVLEQHYMRGQTLVQQEKVIEAVEKGILDTPQSRIIKRRLEGKKEEPVKKQKKKAESESDEGDELEEVYKELRETKKELQKLRNLLDHHKIPY
jgi:hypothetical protein